LHLLVSEYIECSHMWALSVHTSSVHRCGQWVSTRRVPTWSHYLCSNWITITSKDSLYFSSIGQRICGVFTCHTCWHKLSTHVDIECPRMWTSRVHTCGHWVPKWLH